MEYSLQDVKREKEPIQFESLDVMFAWIKKHGELDGWIIRVHFM